MICKKKMNRVEFHELADTAVSHREIVEQSDCFCNYALALGPIFQVGYSTRLPKISQAQTTRK